MNYFFLEDRCPLTDHTSFVLTFSWRGLVFAMGKRDRSNKNKFATLVFSVTTKDFPHDILLYGLKSSFMDKKKGLRVPRDPAERFFAESTAVQLFLVGVR
jgi:hypothetical protein